MLNIADTLHAWCREARPFALATVVQVSGSAPLPPGTALAVNADGQVVGSISGGCVEGAVYDQCQQVLQDHGLPARTRFGYSDDDAFAVGLTCGGEIDVLVQRIEPADVPHLTAALEEAVRGRPATVAQIVDGPDELLGRTLTLLGDGSAYDGTLGGENEDRAVVAQARALLSAGRTARIDIGGDPDTCPTKLSVLIHTHAAPPRMLIFGAVDFAAALSQAGSFLGYRVTVCDARPVFATAARFPHADEVVVDWPHRYLAATETDARTALCVLTHDAKFDIPVLALALSLPVGYVGAMGSRRTHHDRDQRLREAGVTTAQLARLNSPIGLDLGAHTPEETAISITAEIIAHSHRATGLPLSHGTGPIHRSGPANPGPSRQLEAQRDPARAG
ncbi:XdhC family protein [Streptomyces stelliscabiei]|uniref:XdhC family protein n=1 Tax=Streptomyces stelliscabiei TaxID=146820 RepID=UPI0029A9084A|nr:XdhC/CoxI family protein [Streptomyces stelliscabiei]MDX2557337.1 XdhC family protein [Streptomyces stelliscabiei]MDX2616969.1 XdhC family protein [Streptomyces stelliscabiei]MDX2641333.1 XdhC family protein [Streptomyces stelliscabiei]MDX2665500.1 XdhC family protein [Streptomyces stelliscabiei]MDX2715111.1 XdhC family protein [Streptomyces stelliscabiei]